FAVIEPAALAIDHRVVGRRPGQYDLLQGSGRPQRLERRAIDDEQHPCRARDKDEGGQQKTLDCPPPRLVAGLSTGLGGSVHWKPVSPARTMLWKAGAFVK